MPEPGPIAKIFGFVFLSFIVAFLALIGLVFVEAGGGPTPFDPPLIDRLDEASGWTDLPDNPRTHEPIEVDIPANAAEAREEFDQLVEELQQSSDETSFDPPPGFFDPDVSD